MIDNIDSEDRFERARIARDAAQATLERLDYAERHQAELQQKADRQQRLADLEDAQGRARAAKDAVAKSMADVDALVCELVAVVKNLKLAEGEVQRAVRYEQFGVRDGLIDRVTISPGIGVDGELGVLALRVAKELVRLSPISLEVAEVRSNQRKL
jgi:hypothetical protein